MKESNPIEPAVPTKLHCAQTPQSDSHDKIPSPPQAWSLPRVKWWIPAGVLLAIWTLLIFDTLSNVGIGAAATTPKGWIITTLLHLPYLFILAFLAIGIIERIGYYWNGRPPEASGRLPENLPTVCIQLPMFNEHAVARRIIEAAAAIQWPRDRFSVQVLDDSTDPAVRDMVRAVCAQVRERTDVNCTLLQRTDRKGYKAGALEVGRQQTDAEFLAIFDADFVPPADFLIRAMPYFFKANGDPEHDLGLVQCQWGHLNDSESFLTQAQALWVDDHHALQKPWRSAAVGFVNFTGTAGVWRAAAIEAAGGWKAASLVEDCELSFRALFAGYRTRFVKHVVVPAELPATYAAYRLQQRRWTQGWVQLQRMHLSHLLFRYRTPLHRRIYLAFHMCIPWQWPAWAIWITIFPFLVVNGDWLGANNLLLGFLVYAAPPLVYVLFALTLATVETKKKYADQLGAGTPSLARRLARIGPYILVNAGMFPHHLSAFIEGLFGPMHGEFERTPKAATIITAANQTQSPPKKRMGGLQFRAPYVATELAYVITQLAWVVIFLIDGLFLAAVGAGWLAACVGGISIASYFPNFIGRRPDRLVPAK